MYYFHLKAHRNLRDCWVWHCLENYLNKTIYLCWETAWLILQTEWSKYWYCNPFLKFILVFVLAILFKSIVNNPDFSLKIWQLVGTILITFQKYGGQNTMFDTVGKFPGGGSHLICSLMVSVSFCILEMAWYHSKYSLTYHLHKP